ncbi:hypothetical protein VB711_06590 [Cronbergia sp. UHCC 0137]|uniref:hypothetical protein n=1 Tax=Cronbergia sp. UHCC 0137 TaxID=3110239 RepID=UPI002B20E599|nr:hypothetical protein [Cronbergia sp. UHCC 0137]MEA5617505.1 hypothetical protein [Cronbergia sp. UHCC 0137]
MRSQSQEIDQRTDKSVLRYRTSKNLTTAIALPQILLQRSHFLKFYYSDRTSSNFTTAIVVFSKSVTHQSKISDRYPQGIPTDKFAIFIW